MLCWKKRAGIYFKEIPPYLSFPWVFPLSLSLSFPGQFGKSNPPTRERERDRNFLAGGTRKKKPWIWHRYQEKTFEKKGIFGTSFHILPKTFFSCLLSLLPTQRRSSVEKRNRRGGEEEEEEVFCLIFFWHSFLCSPKGRRRRRRTKRRRRRKLHRQREREREKERQTHKRGRRRK